MADFWFLPHPQAKTREHITCRIPCLHWYSEMCQDLVNTMDYRHYTDPLKEILFPSLNPGSFLVLPTEGAANKHNPVPISIHLSFVYLFSSFI